MAADAYLQHIAVAIAQLLAVRGRHTKLARAVVPAQHRSEENSKPQHDDDDDYDDALEPASSCHAP